MSCDRRPLRLNVARDATTTGTAVILHLWCVRRQTSKRFSFSNHNARSSSGISSTIPNRRLHCLGQMDSKAAIIPMRRLVPAVRCIVFLACFGLSTATRSVPAVNIRSWKVEADGGAAL
jgi:hypothetical protein